MSGDKTQLELRRVSGSSNLRSLMHNYQIFDDVLYLRIFGTCENCEHFRLTDEHSEVNKISIVIGTDRQI